MRVLLATALAGVLWLGSASAYALEVDLGARTIDVARFPIRNFREVSPGIYRGARPGRVGMRALAELGIRTDLNLEDDLEVVRDEVNQARELGIRIVTLPMSGFFSPSDETANAALALIADSANYPIFIHCHHGEDRTGLIVGLYRVFNEGWQPAAAYREMKKLGFHPVLLGLTRYFKQRTGYDD